MKNIYNILDENAKLISDLNIQLNDTKEVIEAIKKGNIDALLLVNNQTARVLVSTTADQSYRKFIQNMSEGVVTLHADGTILYANNSFARIVGLPLEKVTGSNFKDFISPIHLNEFETLSHDFRGNNTRIELLIINHDNITAFYIVTLNKITIKELVTLNLVLTDISDLKKTEESLLTIIDHLNLAIDKQKLSEEELVNDNYRLREHIKVLEAANIKLSNFKR